jgi:hypothetical protein
MSQRPLRAQGVHSKDVTPPKNASRGDAAKKSAEMLPKILWLARRGGSLQRQRVKCGKHGCKCSRGELHDGYYYFFIRTPTGLTKFYVRRNDVPAVRAVISERVRRRRMWRAELEGARNLLRIVISADKRGLI